jgi:hypothetical protein
LFELTEPVKAAIQGKYLGCRWDWLRSSGRDIGSVNGEAIEWFDERWKTLEARLEIVPGKEILGALRERVKAKTGITLTDNRILAAVNKEDVPIDMASIVRTLEDFRTKPFGDSHRY